MSLRCKLEAIAIIACGLAIAGSIVWSIALLFWTSPAWGIVGCVVLATSGTATHKVLGR